MASYGFGLIIAFFFVIQVACTRVLAGVTMVGSVYCDQCLEGHRTAFGMPIKGAQVHVECTSGSGSVLVSKDANTDVLGMYSAKLSDESANDFHVEGCTSKVLSSPMKSCNIAANNTGPASLSWKLFGMAMYTSQGLSFKPAKRMSFCPSSSSDSNSNSGSKGGVSLPPLPFIKLSACPHQTWMDSKYRCYWRLLSPSTKVSMLYGPGAEKKIGADLTLEQGLRGSGDVRRVLLRESITASLNAFNSVAFYYNAVEVAYHFNEAMDGTEKDALTWANNFRRANAGYNGQAKCLLAPCT